MYSGAFQSANGLRFAFAGELVGKCGAYRHSFFSYSYCIAFEQKLFLSNLTKISRTCSIICVQPDPSRLDHQDSLKHKKHSCNRYQVNWLSHYVMHDAQASIRLRVMQLPKLIPLISLTDNMKIYDAFFVAHCSEVLFAQEYTECQSREHSGSVHSHLLN